MIFFKKAILAAVAIASLFAPLMAANQAYAGSYNLSYHSTPNSQNCTWVYRWKWVYGKKVRVKVKVCN